VIEGAQLIFEALELPQMAWQVLTIQVLLGFPVALVLAWTVDLPPNGIERAAAPAEGDESPVSGRRSSLAPWALTSVTAAAVVLGAFWILPRGPGGVREDGDGGRVPIAVLPFDTYGGLLISGRAGQTLPGPA
jgi:hypothetical protein